MCLLDTTVVRILTDRLYRKCEKHDLLDPSQEVLQTEEHSAPGCRTRPALPG
jgi:hypothetical protein